MHNHDASNRKPFATITDRIGDSIGDTFELLHLSLKLQLGKRFWIWPFLPLAWILLLTLMTMIGFANIDYIPALAQNSFIGIPVYLLAIALGMQIISSEIEQRTLEVCYTVPGGAKRIWLAKLAAACLILIAAELILALYVWFFFTHFPLTALLRVLQGLIFFLVLSMAFGALFKNKMTAGMASAICLFFFPER